MNWILLVENWGKIVSILLALSTFVVSPMMWFRWMKARNELREMEVTAKKNRTFREELDLMNSKIDELTEEVRKLRQELHQERMETISLKEDLRLVTVDKSRLESENMTLRRKIDEGGL